MQSKLGSFIESIINVLIGFGISLASQLIIFPYYDVHISFEGNVWITVWFTIISIIRSYLVRRFFNKKVLNDNRP